MVANSAAKIEFLNTPNPGRIELLNSWRRAGETRLLINGPFLVLHRVSRQGGWWYTVANSHAVI